MSATGALHADRARAESFGADAGRYDRSRPSYPPELVDALVAHGPRDVLDVGCGTGIAARLLAGRGCAVTGVEVDARMAAVARTHGVAVEVAAFEDWDAAGRTFDLIGAGQAWHWVDPGRGAARAAALLRPGGRIGVFWNFGRLPPEVASAVAGVYDRLGLGVDEHSVALGRGSEARIEEAAAAFAAESDLGAPSAECFPWRRRYATIEWLDQLPTHSDHGVLPPGTLAAVVEGLGAALESLGGSFTMEYDAWLVSAPRR